MLATIVRGLPSLRSFRVVAGFRGWASEVESLEAAVTQSFSDVSTDSAAGVAQSIMYKPVADKMRELLSTPLTHAASADEASQSEIDVSTLIELWNVVHFLSFLQTVFVLVFIFI